METIPNKLDDLPLITPSFKMELAAYDIHTTNQLIGAYARFNFNFIIADKIFIHTPEHFVHHFFLKLKKHGIEIPSWDPMIFERPFFDKPYPTPFGKPTDFTDKDYCKYCGDPITTLDEVGCYGDCQRNDEESDSDGDLDRMVEYYSLE